METKKKEFSFSKITYQEICEIVDIAPYIDDSKFEEWFSYDYKISEEENKFLTDLINNNRRHLPYYNEVHLMVRFIGPVLNKVNFFTDKFKDWYNYYISAEINGYKLGGKCDFMVASGLKTPSKPFFFIQEFKQYIPSSDPENQLIAEMIVAIKNNKANYLKGSYVIGDSWKFVFLEKIKENKYKYYISKSFDCLDLTDLKQIFINLQFIKNKIYL